MQIFNDEVLGEVEVRRHRLARSVRMKISPKGALIASAPPRMPLLIIKQSVKQSRSELQQMLNDHQRSFDYTSNQEIGKSHTLTIEINPSLENRQVSRKGRTILVQIKIEDDIHSSEIQYAIRREVTAALRREGKAYLSRRLTVLSQRLGYSFTSIRFSHAGTRWGSCSSNGTISLNIALMKLPLEIIDYVIIHELCHTKQMNHSITFWQLVERCDPHYKLHRRQLKKMSPAL